MENNRGSLGTSETRIVKIIDGHFCCSLKTPIDLSILEVVGSCTQKDSINHVTEVRQRSCIDYLELFFLELIGTISSAVLVHTYAASQPVHQMPLIKEAQEIHHT